MSTRDSDKPATDLHLIPQALNFRARLKRGVTFAGIALLWAATGMRADTSIQLGDSTGASGSTIEVPLKLFTSEEVSAAQIDLFLDPAVAQIESLSGASSNAGHTIDSEELGVGRVRVVVYSNDNSVLTSEELLSLRVLLTKSVGENGRSVLVESVKLANSAAGFVGAALIPNATFAGPDSSVVYSLGDHVNASSVAFDTNGSINRVDFLVNGQRVASDSSAPFALDFPLRQFGRVSLSAQAVDNDGNVFRSSAEDYVVTFPASLEDWLDVFFTAEEQQNPEIGSLLADADFDGNSTLMEFALGLNPRRGESPRSFGFFRDQATGSYYFSLIRPVGLTEVDYTLEFSNELEVWNSLTEVGAAEVVSINEFIEEVRFPVLNPEGSSLFGRVLMERSSQ